MQPPTVGRVLAGVVLNFCIAAVTTASEPLEEIVVTADFRERAAADLPASVTVLDTDTIEAAALTHFEELTHLIPNFNFAGGSNRPRYFQIRGTGERSQYEGAPNPSVGFLIDDIDFSAIGGVALTWDIEQLEVLRGPQGTRYGANALAGLINVRTAGPTNYWTGKAGVAFGGDDARSIGAAVGGPAGKRASFRLSTYHYESNGFRDNEYLDRDDTNGRDESEFRAKFSWLPNDDWKLEATALYVDADNGYDAFAIDNSFTTQSDRPGRDAQRSRAGALKLTWLAPRAFDIVSLTSVAASAIRFSFDADWGNDVSWAPYSYDFISERERIRETVGQEFRFVSTPGHGLAGGRLDWLFGVYALQLREDLDAVDRGLYVDPVFGPFAVNTEILSDYEALNSAIFAQADWQFATATRLSAGLRIERRDADYADTNGLELNPSETMLGGHLSLSHELSDTLNGYTILSRGYKAGGFNLGQVPEGRREFDAEFVWNLEVGTRLTLEAARVSLRAAAFVAERKGQQISTSFQINPNDPSSFIFFLDNAASGRDHGLELEAVWQITEPISAYLNLGLLSTEIELKTPDASLDGRAQAHAPDYTFAAGLSWTHDSGLFARIDVNGKDAFYFSNSHDQRSRPYTLWNARAGFRWEGWQLSVWGRNLTDEPYAVRGFFFGNEPPEFPETRYVRLGDRRQIGVSLDYAF